MSSFRLSVDEYWYAISRNAKSQIAPDRVKTISEDSIIRIRAAGRTKRAPVTRK